MGNNLVYVSSIFLFMVVHYCFIACLGKPLNSITDQQALLALKAHMITNHDEYPYTKNPLTNNWTIGTNMCSWIGISCSVRHQRVTSLTLPNLSLLGTIPPHIGNLSFLSSLNLINNSFQGHLPPEIGHLRRLKFIGLEFNNFTGEIPTSIGNLTMLKYLYLRGNIFTEYGSEGSVSTRCDVYSYGILLMETFSRTKPTDERFAGDLSLKGWVNESLPNSIFEVIDTNLISPEEQHFTQKLQCVSAIMELSLNCSAELPHDRTNMKDTLVALQKIRCQFLANKAGT